MDNNNLNLQQKQILTFLCKECGVGFKVFEVADLQTLFEKCDIEKTISKFELLNLVVVKYFDEQKICLATTQKGQLAVLSFDDVETTKNKSVNLFFVFVCAFFGAFIGTLCASVIALFF